MWGNAIMGKQLTKRFWTALVIFSLMGQVAWVVENMYFNVFIYKMFHASAADISRMVGASSVAATVTTILVGAFSDYIGRRKLLICGGYIAWGISIVSFAFIRMDILTPMAGNTVRAASLGVSLVILMDCVMTFLGSSANDASFNAWMTDWGADGNRGRIEGINSMMPLVGILVVFGGFSAFDLEQPSSWTMIYLIVGAAVLFIGVLGIILIDEKPGLTGRREDGYFATVIHSFRPSVIKGNPLLYAVIGAFAIFGISIQIFMPYLILYYEKTLGMTNYVFIMAPAIVIAAVITAFYGKLYDLLGFRSSVVPTVLFLIVGYVLLYVGTGTGIVFIGSLLMMTGYLTGMAIFGAMIRSNIPEKKAGQFQGIRIIGQVLVPGIVGPAIGAYVLRNAEQIVNSDGTTSFLPNRNIYLAALVAAVLLLAVLYLIFAMMRNGHNRLLSHSGEALMKQLSGNERAGAADMVWNQYPRPQMKRESFCSLNGIWELDGKEILVPFPPQSLLSGFRGHVGNHLTYRRKFVFHKTDKSNRILLHFGAVDQVAKVFVNGRYLGKHEGGYLPFSFDITECLDREDSKDTENLLEVKVKDTLSMDYPYGKQRRARGGMWYTPVSGIWQSVWLEEVPQAYISSLKVTADMKHVSVEVRPDGSQTENTDGISIRVTLHDGTVHTVHAEGNTAELDMTDIRLSDGSRYQPILWSMENPYLYRMTVTMGKDTVKSYFGLRTVEIKEVHGLPRVCLNGKPIFLNGVLDQGYFCDGIYLPAEEEEYERDVLRMKELGFHMLRKHIKIEPECFYYDCDVHGMLVMQDMVNSGRYSWLKDTALPTLGIYRKDIGAHLGRKKRKAFFRQHMRETIMHLHNHPCVVAYTIFNEGWGQFESDAMYEEAKELDGTRLYDAASGWFPGKKSDFDSQHIYYKRLELPENPKLPILVSEAGGYSYGVPGHFYAKYTHYGYGGADSGQALTDQICSLYEKTILPAVSKGVCGCIYTQLSDVEDETNGFYTYDRKVLKVQKEELLAMSRRLDGAIMQKDS